MEQPTWGEIMRMIQRIDNKLNWLIDRSRNDHFERTPDLSLFDPLPEQPKTFFINPKERIRLKCGMSKAHCDKQEGVLNKKPEIYRDYNE